MWGKAVRLSVSSKINMVQRYSLSLSTEFIYAAAVEKHPRRKRGTIRFQGSGYEVAEKRGLKASNT